MYRARSARAVPLAAAFVLACLLAVLLMGPARGLSSHGKQLTIYDGHVTRIHGPWGNSYAHDKNGLVPMYADDGMHKLAYTVAGGRGVSKIYYNEYKMRNATPCGWDQMIRHEKAHAKGFSHGEGRPPDGDGKKEKGENPAFYGTGLIHCHYPATADNRYANKY
jgi:hypothetical protein